uniref:Serine proteinase n=1 Tax=Centruroides hentzi TaxID=88313 RepID=A0A2I9LPR7_9SCOR
MILFIFAILTILITLQVSHTSVIPDQQNPQELHLKNATIKEFPSSMALFYNNTFRCSATLITRKTAITTATCCIVFGIVLDRINNYGILGEINSESENAVKVMFDKIIVHPGIDISYNDSIGDYKIIYMPTEDERTDLCLMILDKEVTVTDYVKPIALPTADVSYSHKAIANGWQLEKSTSRYILKKMNAEITKKQYCENHLTFYKLEYKEMCGKTSHPTSCLEESGGSLIISENNEDKLVGILRTSYGCRCADDGCPLIYIEVKKLLQWILQFAINDD